MTGRDVRRPRGEPAMMMFQTLARVMRSPMDTLKIECGACHHRATWPRARAFEVLGGGASPRAVRDRLRCGRCGDTRSLRVWI
jgi:ribosomal protein S27AE